MTRHQQRNLTPEAARKRKRAYSTIVVLMTMLAFATVGVSLMSFSGTQSRAAHSATGKIQANILAESGIHVLYDRIRAQMAQNQTYPRQTEEANVKSAVEGDEVSAGTYRARVVDVKSVQSDVTVNGNRKIRRTFYTFMIEGDGSSKSGSRTRYRAKFDASIDHAYVKGSGGGSAGGGQPDTMNFPVGALASNSSITYRGEGGLKTYSPSGNDGHLVANGGVEWDPPSGDKSSHMTDDIVQLEGQVLVPSGSAYERTAGPAGLGNPNGRRNFKTPSMPADGSFPGSDQNKVQRLVDPVVFASANEVSNWHSAWFTTASSPMAAAGFSDTDDDNDGRFDSDDITPRGGDGALVIQTPARVRGDMRIEAGDTVLVLPRGNSQKHNVLYVEGNLENRGQLRNLGVNIVTLGKYRDTPNAKYEVSWTEGSFTNRSRALQRSTLISLSANKEAVKFDTNMPCLVGLVMVPRGGIAVTGDSPDLSGLLVAGGTGRQGGILVAPGDDGQATFRFEPAAAYDDSSTGSGPSGGGGNWNLTGVAKPFVAGELYDWVEIPLDSSGNPVTPTATNVGVPPIGPVPAPTIP